MAHLELKTQKPAAEKKKRTSNRAPICRRCGGDCSCSEEEIDAGGPA